MFTRWILDIGTLSVYDIDMDKELLEKMKVVERFKLAARKFARTPEKDVAAYDAALTELVEAGKAYNNGSIAPIVKPEPKK